MSTPKPKNEAIVIAIDFGLDFSTASCCEISDNGAERYHIINSWPGKDTMGIIVPTIIQYHAEGTSRCKWGYEVSPNQENVVQLFKPLLNLMQSPSPDCIYSTGAVSKGTQGPRVPQWYSRSTLETLVNELRALPKDKTPLMVVSDYLRELYNHILRRLSWEIHPRELKDIVLETWLTVPNGWSHTAKDLTRRAAREAGFDARLVSEPEAVIYNHCLKDLPKDSVKIGDIYVIATCDETTVDLISYKILAVEPKLRVGKCVVGHEMSDACRYSSLNHHFEQLVINRLGDDAWEGMTARARSITMGCFDRYLKRRFVPAEFADRDDVSDFCECPVPGIADDSCRRIRDEELVLTAAEMKGIFEPMFKTIAELIRGQISEVETNIRAPVTGVFLIGEFGSSKYLYKYLSANLRGEQGTPITIVQPDIWWMASGALEYGLVARTECEDTFRIATCSYGIAVNELFTVGVHPAHNMYLDQLTGQFMCSGRMRWLVNKGDKFSEDKFKIWIDIPRRCPTDADLDQLFFPVRFFVSDLDAPPTNVEDPGVCERLVLTTHLGSIPRKHFTLKDSVCDTSTCWEIPMRACISVESTVLEISITVFGITVGRGKITLDLFKRNTTAMDVAEDISVERST